MSLELYAVNNDDDMVHVPNRLRADSLDVTIQAAEASVGSSTIELDDPDGDFYIRGLKALYFQESDAYTDAWNGIIGPFYAWDRTISRADAARVTDARVWSINVNDINTLLTRRLQKGTDAQRPAETDVARMTWLIGTAEVIGGGGDAGFTIEDTTYFFTDSTYPMDKTDYTGQDSSGVINDALQDSGKNCFIYNSPGPGEPIRVGIWYGRTERTAFASVHRISNVLADINADPGLMAATMSNAAIIGGTWTFAPSFDATLNRDPSRVASGVMVQFDGGYSYATNPTTSDAFDRRDLLMQAELVKTQAQAARRVQRYLRDLRNEDDAIEVAVIVPSALVHAWYPGHRVQVKFSHLPGYSADWVWMRVAKVTYRQVSSNAKVYELALDLRAEEPPDSATTGNGDEPCSAQTASDNFYPLGGNGSPNPSDGHVIYWRPGLTRPITVADAVGYIGSWHFGVWGAGGAATTDYAGDCAQNRLRCLVEGAGTMTIHTAEYTGVDRTLRAILQHHQYASGEEGDPTSGVDVIDEVIEGAAGSDFEFDITTHDGENCTHWVDLTDIGGTCGSKWGFTGFDWVAS